MRVILVPVADRPECAHALEAAFRLAARFDANVVGCHIRPHRESQVRMPGLKAMAALEWASALSLSGVRVETDFSDRGLKSQMKRAGRLNARYVLIAGEQELAAGAVMLRNMATREQALIPVDRLVEKVAATVAE